MNLQRDKFPINNEEISLNSEFLFEKESASNKQFGKKSLEALLPRFPEKTKSLTTLKFEEQKYEKTDKLSNPKEEIFGKNISLNEISNKHTNTSDKKNEEISGKNLFMMEQAHENKETILKNPYKKEIGKEENKKFVEKEPALKLNFFEKPKFPSVSSQSLSSLEKKQIESPSKNREKSQTDIKLNIAKDNQGFEKSTFSQFNLIANEKKNEIKADTPTKKEKIEMTQKDEIDDFDDLLGELEFMTNVPRKKESSLIEIKKSEKVSPLFYEKAKETSKNLSIIENEKKKNEMKKDIVENLKEIVKNTSVNDKMKDSKKEIDEEIEEDIDFGE